MKKLFGTDGIRGVANRHPMTTAMALSLGEAIAYYFVRKQGGGRIVIGKDTRRSSYMFEYALSAGISSMGSQTILTGPLPTPGIAFLIRAMRADAGVVISASHNTFQDNGIKFFDREGFKLPDDVEFQMEEFVFSSHEDSIRPTGEAIGRAIRIKDAVGRYVEFLKSTFPKDLTLKGLKIVIDCANGAAYEVGPVVLSEMDATVIPVCVSPNGTNINDQCGALFPSFMAQKVIEHKADLGIALDGDADRVVLCDEAGHVIDGDQLIALLALQRKALGCLNHATVVGTIMNNIGLEVFLKENGLNFVRTDVGDRYIIEEMKQHDFTLGGEPSGHIILRDLSTTGDGLIAALQVIALMLRTGKKVSDLVHQMALFPQKMMNIPVKEKVDLTKNKKIQNEVNAITKDFKGRGRVVLRYSGTEPLLRVMIEGDSEEKVIKHIESLSSCIQENI